MSITNSNGVWNAGLLIAFEGIDGTGKSTQIRLLSEKLTGMGYEVVTTFEPTDGPFGQRIRELFVNRTSVSREEELELFMADRKQHVNEVIAPALAEGKIVLTDRYYLSTVAYQGAAGLNPVEILQLNENFAPRPDLALIFVAPPTLGIHRIQELRGESLNSFEQEEALQKVSELFDNLDGDYIKRIDAVRTIDEIHHDVLREVKQLIGEKSVL